MSIDVRLAAAVLAGKSARAGSRLLRRGGGTTIPGDVARMVDPGVLRKLTAGLRDTTVLVTGTNGKTTTTGMIATALEQQGRRVLSNTSGANLVYGLTAAAVADAGALGAPRADLAVFEVDELSLDRAVMEIQPHLVVVLNFFRDQLDRSGELETTAARVGSALRRLPSRAHIVANVDDPIVWAQCEHLDRVIGIGIDSSDHLLPGLPHAADARLCPHCGSPLRFDRVVLAHCGGYRCPRGDFQRPRPQYTANGITATGIDRLGLDMRDGAHLDVAVGGMYNAYNAVAAYATLRTLGMGSQAAADGLRAFTARFGRMETFMLHGRRLRVLLAKNPAGFDEVLRTADELGATSAYLIAINDNIADGRDVSWLWDVDFERLARSPVHPQIIAAGRRADDLALRLKYAGVPGERISVERDPGSALRAVTRLGDREQEAVVLPTYTAMLELRAVAERAGAVDPFWARAGAAGRP